MGTGDGAGEDWLFKVSLLGTLTNLVQVRTSAGFAVIDELTLHGCLPVIKGALRHPHRPRRPPPPPEFHTRGTATPRPGCARPLAIRPAQHGHPRRRQRSSGLH